MRCYLLHIIVCYYSTIVYFCIIYYAYLLLIKYLFGGGPDQ